MAQHDYNIANGTGAAVRSDLNNALAAIVSQNSGATAPSTTYAYMPWADTTTGLYKIRNAANNGWITLYELDGTFSIEAGSASSPGLYFTGDSNTGIYSPGADQFGIATGGTGRLVIDSSGNVNIDSGTLYVDASNNRVGIGTTSPGGPFDVYEGTWKRLLVTYPDVYTTKLALSTGGYLQSSVADDAVRLYNTANGPTIFATNNTERARIDSSGRLLVGTSTARDKFFASTFAPAVQIEGSTTSTSAISTCRNSNDDNQSYVILSKSRSSSYGVVSSGDSIGEISFQAADGTNFIRAAQITAVVDGTPGANDMPGRLVFSTTADGASSPTERMRIVNNGEIGVNMTPIAGNRLCSRAATNGASILADSADAQGTSWYLFYGTSSSVSVVQAWIRGDGTYGSRPNVYGGTSDIKLKENIEPASSQWNDVKSIELVNYNFIGDDVRQLGVIAQQVETISPGLVDETKDKDSDGNETGTVTKSVKYSVLYLKAVKALQEAMERIETLEAEVAAFKAS